MASTRMRSRVLTNSSAFDGGEEPEGHPSEVAGEDDGDRGTNSAERPRERVRLRPYGAPLVW